MITLGGFHCYNTRHFCDGRFKIFSVLVEPPKSPSVHIVKTTPTSVGVRWRITDDGNSPITKVILNYKMTYGEWADQEVMWYFLLYLDWVKVEWVIDMRDVIKYDPEVDIDLDGKSILQKNDSKRYIIFTSIMKRIFFPVTNFRNFSSLRQKMSLNLVKFNFFYIRRK